MRLQAITEESTAGAAERDVQRVDIDSPEVEPPETCGNSPEMSRLVELENGNAKLREEVNKLLFGRKGENEIRRQFASLVEGELARKKEERNQLEAMRSDLQASQKPPALQVLPIEVNRLKIVMKFT